MKIFTISLVLVLPWTAQGALVTIDPNDFAELEVLTDVGVGARLTADHPDRIVSFGLLPAVIGRARDTGANCCWLDADGFRIEFDDPTSFVEFEFYRGSPLTRWAGRGGLDAFAEDGTLLAQALSPLADPVSRPLLAPFSAVVERPQADISYAVLRVFPEVEDAIRIGRITFQVPEPSAVLLLLLGFGWMGCRKRLIRGHQALE